MRAPVHDLSLSNLFTYLSLASGLAAVAFSPRPGGLAAAGAFLAMSALLDAYDGKFARRFQRTDRQAHLGAELDSLVDAIVFGLVPIVVMRNLPGTPGAAGELAWWAGAFVFALANVTRLAFFNVEGDKAGFVGVPTPVAALAVSAALLGPIPATWVPLLFFVLGLAMIWPVAIPRPRGAMLIPFAAAAVGLVLFHGCRALGYIAD